MLQNDEFTKDLFRFLQLLCEGHNGGEVVLMCIFIENWSIVCLYTVFPQLLRIPGLYLKQAHIRDGSLFLIPPVCLVTF